VKLRFARVLSGGGSATWSQEDRSFFSSIRLSIQSYGEGGPKGILSGVVDLDGALAKFRQFIEATSTNTYVAIEKEHELYELPAPWINRAYYDVFVDPRPAAYYLRRWLNADRQVAGRCEDLLVAAEWKYGPRCFDAKGRLEFQLDDCSNAVRWGGCHEPLGSALLATVESRLPAMDPTQANSSIPYFYVSNGLSRRCGAREVEVCLPQTECIVDRTRTFSETGVCPGGNVGGPGYGVFTQRCNTSGGGASHTVRRIGGSACLRSRVEVCADRWWGGGAWYEGSQELYGKCPVYRPIELQ
jgi:hypothetical protein